MTATNRTSEVAIAAARLVVEEGLDYRAAKRRALRDLKHRQAALPSNEQLEDEVRDYIELFCADTQPGELRALREVALQWMQRLAAFRPHLSGAVWRGTATRLSAVTIDLYCDDPKSAELTLVNQGVKHDSGSVDRSQGGEPLPVLTVASQSQALRELVTVHLTVHDHDDLRGALKPDAKGLPWRADLAALRRLIESQGP